MSSEASTDCESIRAGTDLIKSVSVLLSEIIEENREEQKKQKPNNLGK
jgi:hypothetical protein